MSTRPPDRWPDPLPLEDPDLPLFPAGDLPDWVREQVLAAAEALQVPPDLPGMLALAVIATAVAKKAEVEVKPGWNEPLNLWTCSILPSGEGKTPAFAEMASPLYEYQQQQMERALPEDAKALARYEIAEKRLEEAKRAAAKAAPEDRSHAQEQAEKLAEDLATMRKPTPPRFLTDDTTPEALTELLSHNQGRMAIFAVEGAEMFCIMSGRYSGNARPNLGPYLRGYSGDESYSDRVGRETFAVHRPALSVATTIQPDVLELLQGQRELRGQGLLARFLYAIPRSRVGLRSQNPSPIPEEVRGTYHRQVRALAELPIRQGSAGHVTPQPVLLDEDAAAVLLRFRRVLEPKLAEHGELGVVADWGNKLHGAIYRIAGVLHAAEWAHQRNPWEVSIERLTAERAVAIAQFSIPHAQAAFGRMGADARTEIAKRVWRWITGRDLVEISKSELWQGLKGGRIRKASDLDAALDILEEHHYLEREERDREGGGRRAAICVVNPKAVRLSRWGE